VELRRASVYRLEPTPEQANAFAQWSGACRYVYNLALEQRREFGQRHNITYLPQQPELTVLRSKVDSGPRAPRVSYVGTLAKLAKS
jgi:putative transposase